jgi:hypothetical protein
MMVYKSLIKTALGLDLVNGWSNCYNVWSNRYNVFVQSGPTTILSKPL